GEGGQAGRGDQAEHAARLRHLPDLYARTARRRSQWLGRAVPPQGRADPPRQRRGGAAAGQRGALQGNRGSVKRRILLPWLATTKWTKTPLLRNGKRRWPTRIPLRPKRQRPPMKYPAPWRCNGPPWSRTAAATSAATPRAPASACSRRRRSTICSASLRVKS